MEQEKRRVDRRVVRSRKAIIEAFGRLLEDHDIDKITVSAIAREADIDRKTFYVHFGTIDGLLDALAEEFVNDVFEEVEEKLGGLEAIKVPQRASRMFFATINEAFSHNMALNRRLVESSTTDMLVERIRRPFARLVKEKASFDFGPVPEKLIDCYINYLLGGIVTLYRSWVLSPGEVSLEDVSEIANAMTMNGLGSLELQLG